MRVADFVIALPAVYVVLALRAAMPLVLTTAGLLDDGRGAGGGGMAVAARGVRAVVAGERKRGVQKLRARSGRAVRFIAAVTCCPPPAGSSSSRRRCSCRRSCSPRPRCRSSARVREPTPSWGAMLREAGRGRALVEAPWLLAPAVADRLPRWP